MSHPNVQTSPRFGQRHCARAALDVVRGVAAPATLIRDFVEAVLAVRPISVELTDVFHRGRKPTFDVEQQHGTHELLPMGWTPSAISAERIGIPRATVYRIKGDPAKAAELLETWGIVQLR